MGQAQEGDGTEGLLRAGIAAARRGEREQARDLLMQVIEQDENNPLAWLWLSGVVESLEDQEVCLENVLTLDPDNEAARRGLESVRQKMAAQASPPLSPAQVRAATPVSPAAAILAQDLAPPEPEPEPPPPTSTAWDELEDETRCPYCAAPTEYEDKKCPSCGQDLWIRFRAREKPSWRYWILLVVQLYTTAQALAAPLFVTIWIAVQLQYTGAVLGAVDPIALLSAYLWLPNDLPPEVVSASFELFPRYAFFAMLIPLLLNAIVLIGVLIRHRLVYYFFLATALIQLAFSLGSLALGGSLASGISGAVGALMGLLFIFLTESDFRWERRRILLKADPSLHDGPALLLQGEKYAQRGMWAMAALYIRRATAWMPDRLATRLALVVACIRLKRYDLAEEALKEARRLDPESPKVLELASLLTRLRKRDRSAPLPPSPAAGGGR